MAKFCFHCQCYQSGQLSGIEKHNRRLNKNDSNTDMDKEKSESNPIYINPKQSLYKDCKGLIDKKVVASSGRITRASNWICEAIFSDPDELPIELLDEYNAIIIKYVGARLGTDNILMVVCHTGKGGLPHLHLDIAMISEDNRLSSKTLITKELITSICR